MSLERQDWKTELHKLGKNHIGHLRCQYTSDYRLATTPEEEPIIPAQSIFDFDNLQHLSQQQQGNAENEYRLPTPAECAAHLELLEVFFVLKHHIIASQEIDDAMGIKPVRDIRTGRNGDTKALKDHSLWHRRQVKWTQFIAFAAVRFLAWRNALIRNAESWIAPDGRGRPTLLHLPPLDVLMVWHSFLLNPRMFHDTCRGEPIHTIRIPWRMVHASIGNRAWTFEHDSESAALFHSEVGFAPDLFDQFCSWASKMAEGGGDDWIKLSAFRLNDDDDAAVVDDDKNDQTTEKSPSSKVSATPEKNNIASEYMSLFHSADLDLATQLRDAVVRQAEFVEKMNAHLWIRSPALEGTLKRCIKRYKQFLLLLKSQSKTTIVPTQDIDLIWHTHQCSPSLYAKGVKAMVGRFVNHDDTIEKGKLGDGFAFSRKQFRIRFGTEYQICGCWDCQALLSALEDTAGKEENDVDMAKIAQEAEELVRYYRAVESALRRKKPLPLPGRIKPDLL